MRSFQNYILNEAAESVEQAVVTNKPTDILHLEDSPLPWQKVARLTPEKFAEIFGGKSIVICVPCTEVSTMFGGQFAKDAKSKHSSGYYNAGKTIIVIHTINEKNCQVVDIDFSPRALYANWAHYHSDGAWRGKKYDIPTSDVIESIGGLRLKVFQENGGSKLWVLNVEKFDNKFNFNTLFAPFKSIITNYFDKYNKLLDEAVDMVCVGRKIDDVTKLRKGATWNYAIDNRKGYGKTKFALVGYGKAIVIRHEYSEWPVILHPDTVSVTDFWEEDVDGRHIGKGLPGWKITDAYYEKVAKLLEPLNTACDEMRKEFKDLYSQWVKKFMLGEPIDFDKIEDDATKEVEKAAAKASDDEVNKVAGIKTPEEAAKIEVTENPTDDKKEVKLSKKALDVVKDKMTAWHEGTRKQNLKNCSDAKLKVNWKACKELGYDKEVEEIEKEAKSRNLTLESIQANMEDYAVCD